MDNIKVCDDRQNFLQFTTQHPQENLLKKKFVKNQKSSCSNKYFF